VARAAVLDPSQLDGRTVVLAPHPDDVTLACGGLVSLLAALGAPVSIVFMTDGAGSHPTMDRAELAALRRDEAIVASGILGVAADDVHFLGHPDGGLGVATAAAVASLARLFIELEPRRVVVPHPIEPNHDHVATHRIAGAAASAVGRRIEALTFLVWYWDQWPFTNPLAPPRRRHQLRAQVKMAWHGKFGFDVGRRLTHKVAIGDVIDRKRAALAAHTTQMVAPSGTTHWPTLPDVSNGDWLDLLLQPHELFALTTIG
jgi:LmbE family N-acetylglucosaminyl deacetylase